MASSRPHLTKSQLNLFDKNQIRIGVDEAGRGCLAGPVYAGAVVFNFDEKSEKIRDSKQISEKSREAIFEYILEHHRVGIGHATVEEITRLNILGAVLLAMRRAAEGLNLTAEERQRVHVYVDGNQPIRGLDLPQTTVISGDRLMRAIAAASIVAKVSRDREVRRLHERYPQYRFADHKGYGTEIHREAIASLGPIGGIHRPTFAGVREHLSKARGFIGHTV